MTIYLVFRFTLTRHNIQYEFCMHDTDLYRKVNETNLNVKVHAKNSLMYIFICRV